MKLGKTTPVLRMFDEKNRDRKRHARAELDLATAWSKTI
jgi:hypothetical protein